jgi:hypothetical protein
VAAASATDPIRNATVSVTSTPTSNSTAASKAADATPAARVMPGFSG